MPIFLATSTLTTVISDEIIREALETTFDANNCITNGELPPRENISTVTQKVRGQPFGFSNRVLKKKSKFREAGKGIRIFGMVSEMFLVTAFL